MPAARIKVLVPLLLLLILLLPSTTTVAVATSGSEDKVEPTVFIEFNATFTCNGTDYALEGWVEVPSMIVFNKTDNMLYCIGCRAQGGSVAPEGYVRIGLKNVSPIIPVSSNMVLHVELDVADTSTGARLFYLGTELTPYPQSLSPAYWAPYYYDLVNLLRESGGTAVLEVVLQPYNVTMYPYTGGQKCSLKSFSSSSTNITLYSSGFEPLLGASTVTVTVTETATGTVEYTVTVTPPTTTVTYTVTLPLTITITSTVAGKESRTTITKTVTETVTSTTATTTTLTETSTVTSYVTVTGTSGGGLTGVEALSVIGFVVSLAAFAVALSRKG